MSAYKIEAGTGQHIGDRDEQQDRLALFGAPRAPGYMLAVLADGMGGASGGAMAAEQAIRTARQIFEDFSPATHDVEKMLHSIVSEIDTVIKLAAMSSEMRPQTTLVVLVLMPKKEAIWGHAGDSRLYRFRGPNLLERTVDHAVSMHGETPENNATDNPFGAHPVNIPFNMLGGAGDSPTLSLGRCNGLQAGDAFVLCSDGISKYVKDGEFGAAIAMNKPREAAQFLIRKARERCSDGNGDNCSIAVVKLVEAAIEAPAYQVEKMQRAF
jgi:serine/threonine protein phosphatase PrpC